MNTRNPRGTEGIFLTDTPRCLELQVDVLDDAVRSYERVESLLWRLQDAGSEG
jgi:hypothetical protein